MTRRRFIADELSGDRAALVGEHADHLVRVLRARVGQDFDIAIGDAVRRGRITAVKADRVEFELGEGIVAHGLAEITLVLAVFKFDRMEWAIEKCTELGVSRIVPVISRRTDAHLAAASAKRVERWQRIARQAAEQSRRAAPPEISAPIKLREILNLQAVLRIVLAESEERPLLCDAVKAGATKDGIVLAIGPEGGWTDDELQSFRQAGWISASLGNSILRAETAAMAATAVVASTLFSL
ncbi:MAG TPA: RsmE family RNA methyltransferase [Candidatus Acidoferrum sp.]|jgi:16S rRNA (uracil1498-N3)-methyltransferase|nr:RsmE family RNA methyltransferase [Candidatus Acidoferrum sp.]